jgi:alanine dehydrogenase
MTLVLDDAAVSSLLDPVALVDLIEDAIRAEAQTPSDVPERMNLAGGGRFFRVMPAVVPSAGVMGLKTFFGGGTAGVRYVMLLASIESGEVLAALDACYLTAARTAATSAVAARAFGVKSSVLGVLGSGLEAEVHVRTFAALGGVERVKVFSPNPDSRNRFAERMRAELSEAGVDVVAVSSTREACEGVTHLITATNTGYGGPIACRSADIPAGIHVTAIGSTHQDLREHEPDVLRRAGVLVFDADPLQIAGESGDVKAFLDDDGDLSGVLQLDDVLQGTVSLPAEASDLTVFKSVGTALQDLVAADLAYRNARERGLGTTWPDLAVPKSRR